MVRRIKQNPMATRVLLVLLALLGAAYVLVATSKFGVGLTNDSPGYFRPAQALFDGMPFLRSTHSVMWPPVYPALMAVIAWVSGVDPAAAPRYLNAAVFFAIILITGTWVLRRSLSATMALLVSLALLVSFPLLLLARMAWTDSLFVLQIILFFIAFERYFKDRRISYLLWAAVIAAISCLTRYAGFILIFTGGIFLLTDRDVPLRRRLSPLLIFGVVAAAPISLWLIRNLAVSSTLFGTRYPSSFPLHLNLVRTLLGLCDSVVPYRLPRIATAAAGSVILAAVGITIVWNILRRVRREGRFEEARVLCFVILYLVYLNLSATRIAFEGINIRYISPVYVPLVILASVSLARIGGSPSSGTRILRGMVIAAVGVWLVLSGVSAGKTMARCLDWGAGGYATARWHESGLIAHLRDYPVKGQIYSNYPQAIYFLVPGREAKRSPRKHAFATPEVEVNAMADLKEHLAAGYTAYLAWFIERERPHFMDLDDLGEDVTLTPVAEFPDGTLYLMSFP